VHMRTKSNKAMDVDFTTAADEPLPVSDMLTAVSVCPSLARGTSGNPASSGQHMYSPCLQSWPLSTECAVDQVGSTDWDEGYGVCTSMCYNRNLVTVRHPPSLPQCSCNHCSNYVLPYLSSQATPGGQAYKHGEDLTFLKGLSSDAWTAKVKSNEGFSDSKTRQWAEAFFTVIPVKCPLKTQRMTPFVS
jgi:hypothetical protein